MAQCPGPTGLYFLTSDIVRDKYGLKPKDLEKYVWETTVSFISKGVTDSGWQNYLETLGSMKLNEYVALNQKAYDVFNR